MQAVVDAVGYVSKRPEQFFRAGVPEPIELVTHIVSETFVLGGGETCAVHRGDWWIIRSDVDWLGTHPDYPPEALFFHIVALPEAGPNSMRAEILLTAFAQKVVTVGASGRLSIKGEVAPTEEIWRLIESYAGWKRAVAFSW
jgi:hypothetical protein